MRSPGFLSAGVVLVALGLVFASHPATATVNRVPVLNVEKSCRAAQDYGTTDPKETFRNCMLDEKEARAQLSQKWAKFKPSSRRACVPPNPIPSYVEMLTCLEMDQDALLPYQGAGGAAPSGGPGGFVHDSAPPRPEMSPGPRPAGSF